MCCLCALQDKGLALTNRAIGSGKWKKLRITILDRDGWQCAVCGRPAHTVDHIVPRVKDCRSYAFEPSVFNLEILARNLFNNYLEANITIIPLAVGATTGSNMLHMSSMELGGAFSSIGEAISSGGEKLKSCFRFQTMAVSMDDAIEKLGFPQPDYLKIDVDGLEHRVLEGEPQCLQKVKSVLVEMTNKVQVFVGRHTLSNGNPKYLNYPSGVELPVHPSYLKQREKSIILVEGIFDMLNLYDKGIKNSICCFGTNTLQNSLKQKLMPFKAQGVTHIFVLFDGDDAGQKAAKHLKPILEENEFIVEIIKLPDNIDPGELSKEYIDSIREYIAR